MLGATRLLTRLPSRSSAVANIFARQSRLSSSAIPRQPTLPLITYDVASPRVKMVFDDMIKTFELKGPHQINDFWKVLANHEDSFESLWNRMKVVMAEGEISAKVKEMIYIAVSISNSCDYCVSSHTASARKLGMTDGQYAELLAVTMMANETNRMAFAYRVNSDQMYEKMYSKENAKRLGGGN